MSEFTAENELEKKLIQAQNGEIGGGYGVILNPGFEVGLELEADTLENLSIQ